MDPVVGVCFVLVRHKAISVFVILHEPALPQIRYAFLVTGGTNDPEGMQIDGTFDYIRSSSFLAVDENGEAFQKDLLEKVGLVFFRLDAAVKEDEYQLSIKKFSGIKGVCSR